MVRKSYIHIGIAVDTPHGLMVPVIRDVDKKGLWELAAESAELAQKARDKQLKPAEMQGACLPSRVSVVLAARHLRRS